MIHIANHVTCTCFLIFPCAVSAVAVGAVDADNVLCKIHGARKTGCVPGTTAAITTLQYAPTNACCCALQLRRPNESGSNLPREPVRTARRSRSSVFNRPRSGG